jgi:tetratricopeptide (TPR) repeat protein
MHITNSLGFCYYKQNELDNSDDYYQITLNKAVANNDKVWESIVYINLSKNQLLKGNYNKAVSYAEEAVNLDEELGSFIIHNNSVLGNVLLKNEKFKPAILVGEKIEKYIKENGDADKSDETYFFLSKIASYKKDAKSSALYLDNAIFIKDSLNSVFDRIYIDRTNQQIEVEQGKLQLEKQKQAEIENIWYKNSIIVALFLILIILILTYSRLRLKAKVKEENVILNEKVLVSELKYATESLKGFKKSINDKNKMITHFEKELKLINKEKEVGVNDKGPTNLENDFEAEIIQQLITLAILTKQDWREFVLLFEKVHLGFFKRLKQKTLNLTESEIRLMALSRLQLDNKEMGLILGVGAAAIRQSKSRLRKKIQLKKSLSIEDFALEI